jgi:prepilin-type N-terminal cleavage/methylation domain-containing protein
MRAARGLSLLELLLVLALAGILASVGSVSLLRASREARVREGVAQLVADLQRARSTAQRQNQNATVALTAGAASYTVTVGGVSQVRRLPEGIVIRALDGISGGVTYTAPFGELAGATRGIITVGFAEPIAIPPRTIRIIGVTGKVIANAPD